MQSVWQEDDVHELALAEAIAEVARRHAGGRRVDRIHVVVGCLRQLAPSALTFGFELFTRGTPLEGAELELEEVPVGLRCRRCGLESAQEAYPLCCGRCGARDVEVVRGKELSVTSLELAERAIPMRSAP